MCVLKALEKTAFSLNGVGTLVSLDNAEVSNTFEIDVRLPTVSFSLCFCLNYVCSLIIFSLP